MRGSLALEVRTDDESVRVRRSHVLGGVHRHVDAAVEQRFLELLYEHAAGADLAERTGAIAVPGSRDRNERKLDAWSAQVRRSQVGLSESATGRSPSDSSLARTNRSISERGQAVSFTGGTGGAAMD